MKLFFKLFIPIVCFGFGFGLCVGMRCKHDMISDFILRPQSTKSDTSFRIHPNLHANLYNPDSIQYDIWETIMQFLTKNEISCTELTFSDGGTVNLNINNSNLSDLDTITSLALNNLDIANTKVTNLWPLSDMSTLTGLNIKNTKIKDLEALIDLPIRGINMSDTLVTNIIHLSKLPLHILFMDNTLVLDLSPITNMPLSRLSFLNVAVTNLEVLTNMKGTRIDFTPQLYTKNQIEWLATTKLGIINGVPREYWLEFCSKNDLK